jgi:hypothetical protein
VSNDDEDGISQVVCERVRDQIKIFEEALRQATNNPAPEALDRLRDAADKLMRAIGRVFIEIGRLRGTLEPDNQI